MGWFINNENEEAEIRGATADEMKAMRNEQILMLGLYRLLTAQGLDDALCDELRDRANHRPNATVLPPQRSGSRQQQIVGNSGLEEA